MNAANFLKQLFLPEYILKDENKRELLLYYNFIAYVAGLLALFLGFWALFGNSFQLSLILITIFLLIFLNLIIFPPHKKYESSSIILLFLIVISDLYLFRINELLPYAWIFILFFPFISLMLRGTKKGVMIAIVLAVLLVISEFIPFPGAYSSRGLVFNLAFFSFYFLLLILLYLIIENNRRSFELQVLNALATAREIQEKNEFISSLSHQLRTSLSNIMLVNNLVYNSGLNNIQKDLFDTLKASTNNLIEAVNKIVDISPPDLEWIKNSNISFNLHHTLTIIKDIYSERKDLFFSIELSPNIQNFLIGDPIKIKQIFLNLIQNILLSVPGSMIQHIELSVYPDKETKTDIQISFNTETCLKNTRGEIVDEADNSSFPELTSANLTITKKLIELSGGNLSISHKGFLTVYSFILSFLKDPQRRITEETEKISLQGTKPIKLKDATVLLVEDNQINQKILILSLRNMVKTIDVANNGKEALDKFGISRYDIILMDVQMPVMDGIIAAKKIREIESSTSTQTPIIAITASALSGDRENCLAVGMNDYISKPYQIDILFQKMKALVEK